MINFIMEVFKLNLLKWLSKCLNRLYQPNLERFHERKLKSILKKILNSVSIESKFDTMFYLYDI